jgi:hypothetical protein
VITQAYVATPHDGPLYEMRSTVCTPVSGPRRELKFVVGAEVDLASFPPITDLTER